MQIRQRHTVAQHSIFLYCLQRHVAQQYMEGVAVFPLQERLGERATMLRHTYTAYHVPYYHYGP